MKKLFFPVMMFNVVTHMQSLIGLTVKVYAFSKVPMELLTKNMTQIERNNLDCSSIGSKAFLQISYTLCTFFTFFKYLIIIN